MGPIAAATVICVITVAQKAAAEAGATAEGARSSVVLCIPLHISVTERNRISRSHCKLVGQVHCLGIQKSVMPYTLWQKKYPVYIMWDLSRL